jgi:peptide/nickel transport system substrate-binding protein
LRIALAALAVASLASLSACGSVGLSDTSQGGNTLRVVLPSEPVSMNPVFSVYSDSRSWGSIFDRLVGIDKKTMQPTQEGLLTSWKQETPTTWVFDVRPNVKFHNDEAFDATAAAFTVKEWRDNPKSIWRGYYAIVKDAAAQDGKLVITTTVPYAALPALLTTAMAVPPAYYKKVGANGFAEKPVGTGPFEFTSYASGQSIDVKRNDAYWGGVPALDGIHLTWNAVPSSRYAMLTSGNADLVLELQPQDVASVKANDKLRVISGETGYSPVISLVANKGPLADPRLREAIAKAIDRDALVKAVFDNVSAKASSAFIGDLLRKPTQFVVQPAAEEAKRLVAEAGPAAPEITFGYTSGKYPNDVLLGQAVSSMLESVGFKVNQRAEEYGTYRELRGKGAFDLFMASNSPTFASPDTYTRYFLGSKALVKSCVNEKAYDDLNARALAAPTAETSDSIYAELEKKVISEDYCYVPLAKSIYAYGMTDRLKGFVAPIDATPDYRALSLK